MKNKLPWHKKYCEWMNEKFGGDGWGSFSPSVKFDWWLYFIELNHPMFQPNVSKPKITKIKKPGKGKKVWEYYALEYRHIYKTNPVRNAMTNKLCCTLVDRLGEEVACEIVQFYLNQRDAFYIRNAHHLRFCVQDCETLVTKSNTGLRLTAKTAQKVETASHNAKITQDYLREKRRGEKD